MYSRVMVALLLLAATQSDSRYFRYERQIAGIAKQGQACAVVDVKTFAHAAPELADLRIYRGGSQETPYVLRIAEPVSVKQADIQPLNLGSRGGRVVFDAAMPQGSYSTIDLDLQGKNFIASVIVSGSQAQDEANATRLGVFNVFDLTDQKLGRSTVLHLPVSDFRYLHFQINGPVKSEDVTGLSVESEPVEPAKYLAVASSSQMVQQGHSSVVTFTVPANVPVERVAFVPADSPANFSRNVSIEVSTDTKDKTAASSNFAGEIRRIHGTRTGLRIDDEQLAVKVDAAAGSESKWTVKIDNGDDVPVSMTAVHLEMQARTLCFDAAPGVGYILFYGDPGLTAPRYDYANFFQMEKDATQAMLDPEQSNPQYEPRPDDRPFTERHPMLLWIALVVVVVVLGGVAARSAKQVQPGA
jgi:hypothetical protein